MKSLRDDSLPIDVTRDDPVHRQGKFCYSICFKNVVNFVIVDFVTHYEFR